MAAAAMVAETVVVGGGEGGGLKAGGGGGGRGGGRRRGCGSDWEGGVRASMIALRVASCASRSRVSGLTIAAGETDMPGIRVLTGKACSCSKTNL